MSCRPPPRRPRRWCRRSERARDQPVRSRRRAALRPDPALRRSAPRLHAAGLQIASSVASASAAFLRRQRRHSGRRAAAAGFLDPAASANTDAGIFAPSGLYDELVVATLSAARRGEQRLIVCLARVHAGQAALQPAPPLSRPSTAAYRPRAGPSGRVRLRGDEGPADGARLGRERRGEQPGRRGRGLPSLKRTARRSGTTRSAAGDPRLAPFLSGADEGDALMPFPLRLARLSGARARVAFDDQTRLRPRIRASGVAAVRLPYISVTAPGH